MRTAQNKKRSQAKSPDKQKDNDRLVKAAHQEYLDATQRYLDKARQTMVELDAQGYTDFVDLVKREEIEGFMAHADRQIDQVRRRVIEGQVIGHEEKVFSIFEPHTQ